MKTNLLGIEFYGSGKALFYSEIAKRLKSGLKSVVFTPNPQILLKCEKDKRLKDILNSADYCLPDGIGIAVAARALNLNIKERICGIGAGEFILKIAAENSLNVFLYGGKHGVAKIAAYNLQSRYKGLKICGYESGYKINNAEVIKKIKKSNADIVFVCMGFPKQEEWIFENKSKLSGVKLFIGLGGSIDVWAGKIKRAPLTFRSSGLEWFWRFLCEPKRFGIFLDIPKFSFLILKSKLNYKKGKLLKNKQKSP